MNKNKKQKFREKILDRHEDMFTDFAIDVDDKGNGIYIRVEYLFDYCLNDSDLPTVALLKIKKETI